MKAGWQTKKLADVLQIQNGYAFDSKKFNPSKGMPLVRIRSLKLGIETETWFDGPYDDRYVVKAGDLLIGMDGEFGCFEWKGNPSLLNQRVCRLQDFTGALIPKFLFYGVNDYLKAIEDVTGFATVKHLSSKQVLDIDFPVPPLPEQHRIVAILDEAFDGIATAKANAEKNLQNARALFESHLQSVFTERGEGWVETTVGDQLTLQRGFDITKDQQVDGSVPVVSSGGIKSFHNTPMAKAPGVVIGRKGTLGKCFFLDRDYWPHDTTLWVKDFKGNEPRFVYYLLLGLDVKHLDSGTANPALNRNQVHPIKISWPPVSKQHELIHRFDALSEETQRLESIYQQKLTALDDLKKSLLHQAFSGQLTAGA